MMVGLVIQKVVECRGNCLFPPVGLKKVLEANKASKG